MFSAVLDWMPLRDRIVLLGFLSTIALVSTATGGIVLRRAWLALQRKPGKPARRWRRWAERIVIAAAVLGVACGAYGWLIEPYWLEVTHATVQTPKLPAGAQPIRIVHLSDLQCDPQERLEVDVPKAVAALNPDLICFTGDAVNSAGGLDNFRRCMKALAEIAPTYAVWGNWCAAQRFDFYQDTGVTVLHDRSVSVPIRGQRINLAGVRFQRDHARGIARTLAGVDMSRPTILLCHVPSAVVLLPGHGVDLCLSGHTHGGQVALPGYGALITLTETGKRF